MDGLSLLAMAAETVQQSDSYKSQSDSHKSPDFSIRPARRSDIPYLGSVERSAAQIFRTVNLDSLVNGPTVDPSFLAAMADARQLWVAADRRDEPIGFIGGENIDGNFHLVEISVAQPYQGRGVGKVLMAQMMEECRREGYKAITLTTYRDVPWNGVWYFRMGFSEVRIFDMVPEYWKVWQIEAQHGFNMERRCLLRKIL